MRPHAALLWRAVSAANVAHLLHRPSTPACCAQSTQCWWYGEQISPSTSCAARFKEITEKSDTYKIVVIEGEVQRRR